MNVKMALTDLDNGMSRDGLMELTNYDMILRCSSGVFDDLS